MYYIDPGTGSMLFTILIGVLSAGIYALKNVIIKIRFYISGGKQEKANKNKIPFVIFTDDKRYWNVFKSVCDEFEKRGQALTYMTASPDDPALNTTYEHIKCEFIGEGNKAFAKLNMLNADIVLSTTPGLDVYQWKRSRDVKCYVHLLHAPNDVIAYKMFGLDYFDTLLLSGEYQIGQIRELERLRNLPPKELKVVGMTYMDQMKKRFDSSEKPESAETTVLLAPSWTENGILSRYGGKIIDALLETGYHIVIRPHPQSYVSEKAMLDSLMSKYPNSSQLEWNKDNDNFDNLTSYLPESSLRILKDSWRVSAPITLKDFSLLLKYKLLLENRDSLVQYADVTSDLADRIYNNLNSYKDFDSFCELLKTKELTYTRISRSLLHILLDIKKEDYELYQKGISSKEYAFNKIIGSKINKGYGQYARILGFRKESSALLHEIKKNSSIPLISKLSNSVKELDGAALSMLEKDIQAAHIYESVVADKFGREFKNEFQRQLVIV